MACQPPSKIISITMNNPANNITPLLYFVTRVIPKFYIHQTYHNAIDVW